MRYIGVRMSKKYLVRIVCIFAIQLLFRPLRAETKPESTRPLLLLMFDLSAKDTPSEVAERTTTNLKTSIQQLFHGRLLDSREIEVLLEHEGLTHLLACNQEACQAEIAAKMTADLFITGSLTTVDDIYLVTARLFAVKGNILKATGSATALTTAIAAERVAFELFFGEVPQSLPEVTKPQFHQSIEGNTKLAVLDLAPIGIEPTIASGITESVTLELKKVEGLSVISRAEIVAMLQFEADRQMLGCGDMNCFAEIGGALGVDYLVTGHVGTVGDTHVLILKLIDIKNATTLNRVSESFQGNVDQLLQSAQFAARALVGQTLEGNGIITINSSIANAKLFLDGKPAQVAQDQSTSLGKHSVRLEAKGYYPWFSDIYVDRDTPTHLNVSLTPMQARWYTKWWLWTAVGTVVVGSMGLTLYLTLRHPKGDLKITAAPPGGF